MLLLKMERFFIGRRIRSVVIMIFIAWWWVPTMNVIQKLNKVLNITLILPWVWSWVIFLSCDTHFMIKTEVLIQIIEQRQRLETLMDRVTKRTRYRRDNVRVKWWVRWSYPGSNVWAWTLTWFPMRWDGDPWSVEVGDSWGQHHGRAGGGSAGHQG